MNKQTRAERIKGTALTALLLLFALWLVSPFIHIARSDYARAGILGYRLALGLTIMIILVGKWTFDVLAPQGLARKVSSAKGIALIVLAMIILGFIVYVVGQATNLYLKTAAEVEQQQQKIDY
jgi:presenilin-like A22 family membrane protease